MRRAQHQLQSVQSARVSRVCVAHFPSALCVFAACFDVSPSSHARLSSLPFGSFSSASLHHLEPLAHVQLTPQRQRQRHTQPRAATLQQSDSEGAAEEEADDQVAAIQIRFELFAHSYTIQLQRTDSSDAAAAHGAQSYATSWGDGGWMEATLVAPPPAFSFSPSSIPRLVAFHASLFVPEIGERLQLDPLYVHAPEMAPEEFARLQTHLRERAHALDPHAAADEGAPQMVAWRHSDLRDRTHTHKCGVDHSDAEPHTHTTHAHSIDLSASLDPAASFATQPVNDTLSGSIHRRRRLLQSSAPFPSAAYPAPLFPGSAMSRWTGCFPGGDAGVWRMSIGIAVDVGFYNLFPSRSDVAAFVAQTLAVVNRVYAAQLGVQLVLGELLLMDAPGTWAWNHLPSLAGKASGTVCPGHTISSVLDDFTAWRRDERSGHMALWHLFTNCFPPPGIVGLSWMDALCRNDIGTGVSSFSASLWLTFAHELGHNFGGAHTFQKGEGQTGGLMDYADGSWPLGSASYGFASIYSREALCEGLTHAWQIAQAAAASPNPAQQFTPYCIDTSAPFKPVCGNGVVEGDEQCDDTSGCCNLESCLLKAGKQCTTGSADADSQCCQNCLFEPATTECNTGRSSEFVSNAKGYCSNGLCAPSSCGSLYWGSLKYCGLKADNACRQTCSIVAQGAEAACTDGFSTPSMNLPLGTLCKAFPRSTCQPRAGTGTGTTPAVMECVQSVAGDATSAEIYSWVSGPWSTCLGECGTGSVTRTVSCIDANTGLQTDEAQCGSSGAKPDSSIPCQLSPCPNYGYSVPVWSPCDTDCGMGTQHSAPRCINLALLQPVVVPEHFCATSGIAVPPSTRECIGELGSSCPLAWRFTAWSPCSKTCGGGVEVSQRSCVQTRNAFAHPMQDQDCVSAGVVAEQGTSRSCNTHACPHSFWSYSMWSSCSASCGGGTQSRAATCMESATGAPAPDAQCNDVLLNPLGQEALVQACRTEPCPVYAWDRSTEWSACSVHCGGGEQYARIQCFDQAQPSSGGKGVVVADQLCASTRPSGTRSCNTSPCPDYRYRTGSWSECSADCDGGQMSREVSCFDTQGIPLAECTLSTCPDVADSFCVAKKLTRPPASSPCNQQACIGAMWWAQDWGDCSAGCGGTGTQTRQVDCVSTGTFSPVDAQECGGEKPATTQSCNTHQCTAYQWLPGSWSPCSAACDGGTRSRRVSCVFGSDTVAGSLCAANAGPTPPTQGACGTQACATFWWTSEFSTCSKSCEYGSASRTVECRSSSTAEGVLVPDTACTSTKPADNAVCNAFPCPVWVTSEWGGCSARCGDGGTHTRVAFCLSFDNQIMPDDSCVSSMPPLSESCSSAAANSQPCPHWHRGTWGDCSRPCGSGVQNRTLTCRMPHDDVWNGRIADDWSLCPEGYAHADGDTDAGVSLDSSSISQVCNTNPCTDYYFVTSWSACSRACGGGTQRSESVCIRSADDQVVSSTLCAGELPPQTRVCATAPCPSFEWFNLTDWTACSVQCGEGIQTREVRCRDVTPRPEQQLTWELAATADCDRAGLAALSSQRACIWPAHQCFGLGGLDLERMTISRSTILNGRCVAGSCVCRTGFGPGGSHCNLLPELRNVTTNSLQYASHGIPLGEPLQITWSSSAAIEFVTIMLVNERLALGDTQQSGQRKVLPLPQLIAPPRLLNNGSFLWRVGEGIQFGLGFGGAGWRIRVAFRKDVFADSRSLVLANPCGYVSCGKQGRCGFHGKCLCNTGWSGESCERSACADLKCNAEHSSCVIGSPAANLSVSTGQSSGSAFCSCTDGWTGSHCATPPACPATCEHGGDFAVSGIVLTGPSGSTATCPSTCACTHSWSATTNCRTCALTCSDGGSPRASCDACECRPGFFGHECQCSYYLLSFRLRFEATILSAAGPGLYDVASWIHDDLVRSMVAESLRRDFASALGVDSGILDLAITSLTAVSGEQSAVDVVLRMGKQCKERQFLEVSTDAHGSSVRAQMMRRLLQSPSSSNLSNSTVLAANPNADLLSIYSILALHLSDLSSPLYRGLITSFLDPSVAMHVSDPTGRTDPADPALAADPFVLSMVIVPTPTPEPISTPLVIVLAAAGGAAVVLALLTWALRSWLRRRRKIYAPHHSGGEHAVVPNCSPSPPPPSFAMSLSPAAMGNEGVRRVVSPGGGGGAVDGLSPSPCPSPSPEPPPSASLLGRGFLGGAAALHVPLYSVVATSSHSSTPADSGSNTPAVEMSAPSSRRASDADTPSAVPVSLPRRPLGTFGMVTLGGGVSGSSAHAQRKGSYIQHIRLANPAQANVVRAQPEALQNAVLDQTFNQQT